MDAHQPKGGLTPLRVHAQVGRFDGLIGFAEPGPTWKASGFGLEGTFSGLPLAVIAASLLPRPSWKPAAWNGPWVSPALRIWPSTRRLPDRSSRQTHTVPVGRTSIEALVGCGGGFGAWYSLPCWLWRFA